MKGKIIRLQVILLFIIASISLTGCVRMNYSIDIKSNGKVDVSMLYAVSSVMQDDDTKANTDKEIQEMIDKGWECETYDKDDYYGYTAKKTNIKLNDLKENFIESEKNIGTSGKDSPSPMLQKKGFKYIFDWPLVNSEEDSLSKYKEYMEMSGGYATITMSFPYEPKVHNASRVSNDGKTLTWDLLEMNAGDGIHVEFSIINKKLVIACIVTVAILVIGAAVLIVILKKRKQSTISQTPAMNITTEENVESKE